MNKEQSDFRHLFQSELPPAMAGKLRTGKLTPAQLDGLMCDRVWQYLLICQAASNATSSAVGDLVAEGVIDEPGQIQIIEAHHLFQNALNATAVKYRGATDKQMWSQYGLTPLTWGE